MTKYEHAKQFLNNGIACIPLRHRGKEPESSLIRSWEPYRTVLPTEYELSKWLHSGWQNYGVVCGWRDLVVIDFDDAQAFDVWLNYFAILNKHEEVYPMPYIVRTARGAHAYVSMPNRGAMANEKRRGVDIKVHGYVVGPGSVHPSGAVYEPMGEFRLIDVFSLDTILPIDLFPKIAPDASCGHLGALQIDLSTTDYPMKASVDTHTQYDPFQAAMFATGEDLISKVKQAVRIEQFQWRELQRTSADGRWFAALCPFHDDHSPSFWIDTRRQLCGCATCGMKPMDAINLYARMKNVSESQAVTMLAEEVHIWA